MHLTKIELRDWKAYESAIFEFPAPVTGANIVLIGAPNGYGKTSLYQAIILCMFGRDGMLLVENPMSFVDSNKHAELESDVRSRYIDFMTKVLHSGATSKGRNSCSVTLVFDDDQPIEISRVWHFNDAGKLQPDDEEVRILVGNDRKALPYPPDLASNDRKEWCREYIARTFLPRDIAPFFVFDGEQVRTFAEREMKQQVLMGIEGLLGIPQLRALSTNLKDYMSQRLSKVPNVTDAKTKGAQAALDKLMRRRDKNIQIHAEIAPKLEKAKNARNSAMHELMQIGVGAQSMSDRYRKLAAIKKSIKEKSDVLERLLPGDFSLTLFGRTLREKLRNRLVGENVRSKWESGKQQGDERIDSFLNAIDLEMDNIQPPISDAQQARVLEIAREAWEKLWFPPPPNCADSYLHEYLTEQDRSNVIDKIDHRGGLAASHLINLQREIDECDIQRKRISDDIARLEKVAPEATAKGHEIEKLGREISIMEKEVDKLNRERQGLDSEIEAKNTEVARLISAKAGAEPVMRRTDRARVVADMIDAIIQNGMPEQIKKIAAIMTTAYKSMAHKTGLVERVEIAGDGDVKLLNAQGRDIHSNDLSAGEEQIFTQSLFAAVSTVSNRAFPVVVDTPLGRLDDEHRKGVLKHLSQRGQQVILLSTNTEVVGPYLREINANVQCKYLIEFNADGEHGRSSAELGYFSDSEVAP